MSKLLIISGILIILSFLSVNIVFANPDYYIYGMENYWRMNSSLQDFITGRTLVGVTRGYVALQPDMASDLESGSADYVNVTITNGAKIRTIVIWVKPESISSDYRALYSLKQYPATGKRYSPLVRNSPAGRIDLYAGASTPGNTGLYVIRDGYPVMITLVMGASDEKILMYFNATLVMNVTYANVTDTDYNMMYFGWDGANNKFDGLIGYGATFNWSLQTENITTLYNSYMGLNLTWASASTPPTGDTSAPSFVSGSNTTNQTGTYPYNGDTIQLGINVTDATNVSSIQISTNRTGSMKNESIIYGTGNFTALFNITANSSGTTQYQFWANDTLKNNGVSNVFSYVTKLIVEQTFNNSWWTKYPGNPVINDSAEVFCWYDSTTDRVYVISGWCWNYATDELYLSNTTDLKSWTAVEQLSLTGLCRPKGFIEGNNVIIMARNDTITGDSVGWWQLYNFSLNYPQRWYKMCNFNITDTSEGNRMDNCDLAKESATKYHLICEMNNVAAYYWNSTDGCNWMKQVFTDGVGGGGSGQPFFDYYSDGDELKGLVGDSSGGDWDVRPFNMTITSKYLMPRDTVIAETQAWETTNQADGVYCDIASTTTNFGNNRSILLYNGNQQDLGLAYSEHSIADYFLESTNDSCCIITTNGRCIISQNCLISQTYERPSLEVYIPSPYVFTIDTNYYYLADRFIVENGGKVVGKHITA